jgi:hypothetical protein
MDLLQAIWFLWKIAALTGLCAATTTFAVAMVCRSLQWSPINITVNVNQYGVEFDPDGDVGGQKE